MKNPNAVEIVPDMWSIGKPKSEWTYQVQGFWDYDLKHDEDVSFTKSGALDFCKENGYIPCVRH